MAEQIDYEYEDRIEGDITIGMYRASIVDGVRLYPYVDSPDGRSYLEG